jgi:hypothetical protein
VVHSILRVATRAAVTFGLADTRRRNDENDEEIEAVPLDDPAPLAVSLASIQQGSACTAPTRCARSRTAADLESVLGRSTATGRGM